MKKPKPKRELPQRVTIGGASQALVLAQIIDRDDDGSPRTLRLRGDRELLDLKDMEARGQKLEFLLGYFSSHMLGPKAGIFRVPTMLTEEDAGPTTIGTGKPPMVVHWQGWARHVLEMAHGSMLTDCNLAEPCWACRELKRLEEAGVLEPRTEPTTAGRIEADADAVGDKDPWGDAGEDTYDCDDTGSSD